MKTLIHYLKGNLGLDIRLEDLPERRLDSLPFYLRKAFRFMSGSIMERSLLFLEVKSPNEPNIGRIEKQFKIVEETLHRTPVLVAENVSAITRKRLIQKAINFVVPGKQLFLPSLLLEFSQQFRKTNDLKKALLPSAQVILLFRILNRDKKLDQLPLKEIARRFKYTGAAITKAAENLRQYELCEIRGTKEKYIHFPQSNPELWHTALPLLTSPVIKRVYVDELPAGFLMRSNTTALPEYSEISETKQQFRAIEKKKYYMLDKEGKLVNVNPYEGPFCLEIWKYDPAVFCCYAVEEEID